MRKVEKLIPVQIAKDAYALVAICNDATIWQIISGIEGWKQLPEIPQS